MLILKFDCKNGDEVLIKGYVSVYEKNGSYQLYVQQMEPYGKGKELLKLEELKKKLKAEGIFDLEKKKLVKFPKNIGLVTDQGTPIISDPGYIIAREVINNGLNVISLPGATAIVPALTSSGISPSPFIFYGFLNAKNSKQKSELESLKNLKYTMIFYESVHRIKDTLKNMLDVFGDRNISINREISKIHEEICRGKISELIDLVEDMKGEFVIIVEGNTNIVDFSNLTVAEHIKLYLDDGMSEKDAIKLVAKERNVAKSIIYKEYHLGK